jgi:hypothetical protein
MSNDRDEDIQTSATTPEWFEKWHFRAVHDLAVNQAVEVLQKALARLSEDELRGDTETKEWAQGSLRTKIDALHGIHGTSLEARNEYARGVADGSEINVGILAESNALLEEQRQLITSLRAEVDWLRSELAENDRPGSRDD